LKRIAAILGCAVALLAADRVARAEEAPPDSELVRFMGGLSDSTNQYFGLAAQPADTAGLDSALVYNLDHPSAQPKVSLRPEFAPSFQFNRVDGPVYGGSVSIGRRSRMGVLTGRLGYAAGPNDWLGAGEYEKSFREHGALWLFSARAGRATQVHDRDFGEPRLGSIRALLNGADTRNFLRRDGFATSLQRETSRWRGILSYRDVSETPMATTATWNLFNKPPVVVDNVQATRGHNHELAYELAVRLPLLPITAEAEYVTSSNGIGSDFEYRRQRYALGGDFTVTRWLSMVPQAQYGLLTVQTLPQAGFYLGGTKTLRSIQSESLGGTRVALARLDLIEAPDLLELLHIPHPALLPLQGAVFGAIGAAWGEDPYGGPTRVGDRWPEEDAWLSEAGFAILYRPGVPDPTSFLRLNWAYPLGPRDTGMRFSISFTTGLDLVRPPTN
jgi:hypothetical protein